MERNSSNENEFVVRIESTNDDADGNQDANLGSNWMKKSLSKLVGGSLDLNGKVDTATRMDSDNVSRRFVGYSDDIMTPLVNNASGGFPAKEGQTAGKIKKPSKPPRPPRGPSLDDADIRLVKEISKLAMKKRERIERMKALRKMRPTQTPSSSLLSTSSGSTISAMVVTVIFLLVLIFQGFSSTSSSVTVVGAPQPAPETIVSPSSVPQKSAE